MKILLLTYTFPPTPGIGGRRWAKFSKYLTEEENEFHVIYSKNTYVEGDFWKKDVLDNPKINHYPINFRFHSLMSNSKPNFIQKIAYRFFMAWAGKSKYNPYDNTSFSKKRIVKKAGEIIQKENIDVLIVTGPPQNLFYFSCEIKRKYGIKVILDYRDLWNGHPTYEIFQKKTQKQLNYALFQEKQGLKNADLVFAVNDSIKRALIKLNESNGKNKFHTILNGFDKDDFYLDQKKSKSDKVRMFFAGSIAKDSEDMVIDFVNAFVDLKLKNPSAYEKIEMEFNIKTNSPDLLDLLSHERDENLRYKEGFLSKDDYYKKLRDIDVGVVFLTKIYSDAFITKFSDFLLNENYIVQVGYEGEFSSYLKEKAIGDIYQLGDGFAFFEKLIKVNFDEAYQNNDNSEFDIKKIAKIINTRLNEDL